MKKIIWGGLPEGILVSLFLASCAPIAAGPAAQDQMKAGIAMIQDLDKEMNDVNQKATMLSFLGVDRPQALQDRVDAYYAFYVALNFHLASGNIELFSSFMEQAKAEVEKMDAILSDAQKRGAASKSLNNYRGRRGWELL